MEQLSLASTSVGTTKACPRCEQPLTDPVGLGWCQACGYCRSLEEDRARFLPEIASSQPAVVAQAKQIVGHAPRWIWVWLIGLTAAAGLSYAVGQLLPDRSFSRALWTTLQVALGLLTIFLAQFFALLRLAPHDETLSFRDALLPSRLWAQAFGRMSVFTVHFYIVSWSLA